MAEFKRRDAAFKTKHGARPRPAVHRCRPYNGHEVSRPTRCKQAGKPPSFLLMMTRSCHQTSMKLSVLKHGCLRRLRKLKIGRIKIWCCRCWSLAGPQIARAVHDGSVVARQLECLGALLSIRPRTHGGKAVLVYFELEVLNSFFLFFSFISFVLICFVTSCQLKIVVCFALAVFSSNGFAAPDFEAIGKR